MFVIQPSFAAGEMAPAMHGRVDLAKYHVGLATCLNFIVMPQGGAQNRPGTAWVGPCIDSTKRSRVIGFQFNTTQQYALEFSDLKMRVIKDGAYVIDTTKNITAITQANPGVATSVAHGLSNGDVVYLSGILGMVELNGVFATLAGVTADTFQLSGINTTAYTAYASGGTAGRLYTLTTPYVVADLPNLKFVQSNDTMTLTHIGYAPRDLTRASHSSWALAVITFASEQAAPTAVVATPSSANALWTYSYYVTAVNGTTGEESLPSAVGTCTFKDDPNWNAATGDKITITWTNAAGHVAGSTSYNVYKERNGLHGFIGNSGDGATGFLDDKIRADTSDTPPGTGSPAVNLNPFSGAGDWPACVTYHEQRKAFGGTTNHPQTIWLTASGSFKNMNTSSPTQDNDAINRTLASRQANEIRHLVSMEVLLTFTSGAEWKIWPGAQADVLTPSNLNAKAQSYSGANHMPPLVVVNSVLYVQEKGSMVRDLQYNWQTDSWGGVDMTLLASHLFEGYTLQEWAWLQVPYKCILAVRSDGVLLCFTYIKEQEVFAWSRIVTDGVVESVCVIGEGSEDVAYIAVKRTINGATARYVERMASRNFDQIRNAWFLDCALSYEGNNAVAAALLKITGATYARGDTVTLQATGHTPFTAAIVGSRYELRVGTAKVRVLVTVYTDPDTVSATLDTNAVAALQNVDTADWALLSAMTISGLRHLEGETVHILGDGSKAPARTVTNGTVALDRQVSRAIVGLPYDCDLESLDADVGQPTIQGRRKRVGMVKVKVEKTRGLSAGPDVDTLVEFKERTNETPGEPIQPYTGIRELNMAPDWNDVGRVYLRGTPGLPARILALIPDLAVGER